MHQAFLYTALVAALPEAEVPDRFAFRRFKL